VKGIEYKRNKDDDEPVRFYEKILPKMKDKEGKALKIIEFT
jgi:hypothetical protein